MTPPTGNLFAVLPALGPAEEFRPLWEKPGLRVERIVSRGHATPPGEWYDQNADEWVVLLAGAARLTVEGCPEPLELRPGDWVLLPARVRHRVEWTDPDRDTVWLAVHSGDIP
ncbi:cupin domain-containing protein [bacterium]|nr:cupin domain-containing protein [bacterium]